MGQSAEDVAMSFVEAINAGDVDGLVALMTDDHTFVDSAGTVASGRDNMRTGWRQFYEMFPDYRIEIKEMLHHRATVALFGSWSGTFAGKDGPLPESKVGGPAAWKATVAGDKIRFWQVYVDHTRTMRVMEASR